MYIKYVCIDDVLIEGSDYINIIFNSFDAEEFEYCIVNPFEVLPVQKYFEYIIDIVSCNCRTFGFTKFLS